MHDCESILKFSVRTETEKWTLVSLHVYTFLRAGKVNCSDRNQNDTILEDGEETCLGKRV